MSGHHLLSELVLCYSLGLGLLIVAARLRIPSIVALIAAGVLAGPLGLRIIARQEDVELLSEIGVVLLLFMVGLDYSVSEMRRLWRAVLGGGSLQVGLTVLLVVGVLTLAEGLIDGHRWSIGLFVALSSTAIVLKELVARNLVDSPAGRLVVGVLLFQDLCVILLLALAPVLTGRTPLADAPAALGKVTIALVAVTVVGRLILPRLVRIVTNGVGREAFSLTVLLVSLGTAWLASQLGVSMALGAFLAGLVLAGSEYTHQIYAEIRPIRDMLASLFFISIGMLLDPEILVTQAGLVAAVTIGILAVKSVAAAAALAAVRTPLRVAVAGAVALSQVGEFSFVLGRTAVGGGLIPPETWQVLLAASLLTMMLAPMLVGIAPAAGALVARLVRRDSGAAATAHETREGHVLILGFGVGGRLIARALRDINVDYLILDLNGVTVRESSAAGEPIVYGDAANPDALLAAGIRRALAAVIVVSDPDAAARSVRAIRGIAPHLPVIARTRYRTEAERMVRTGATVAVAEELEASLEVLAQLFARLDVPGNVSEVLLDNLRHTSAKARPLRAPAVPLGALPKTIRETPIATHQIERGDWAAGQSLGELNLRSETGATVLAVTRGDEQITSPSADFTLAGADILYLLGDESDIRLAREYLTRGAMSGREAV